MQHARSLLALGYTQTKLHARHAKLRPLHSAPGCPLSHLDHLFDHFFDLPTLLRAHPVRGDLLQDAEQFSSRSRGGGGVRPERLQAGQKLGPQKC